jgi:hypothetical protein
VYNMDSLGFTLRDTHRVLSMFFVATRSFVETGMLLIPRRVGWMAQLFRVTLNWAFTVTELHLHD